MFSPFSIDIPPLAKEKIPPIKSKMMLKIDHPLVLLRFQFQYTAGEYLTNDIRILAYPNALSGFQCYFQGIKSKYQVTHIFTTVKRISKIITIQRHIAKIIDKLDIRFFPCFVNRLILDKCKLGSPLLRPLKESDIQKLYHPVPQFLLLIYLQNSPMWSKYHKTHTHQYQGLSNQTKTLIRFVKLCSLLFQFPISVKLPVERYRPTERINYSSDLRPIHSRLQNQELKYIQNMIEDFRRKMPYCFLIVIIIIIIALYVAFVLLLQLIIRPWPLSIIIPYLIIYHIVLFLLLWSLVQAFRRDPGRVPNQWGFTIDNRNKKYCLICHVFKPQRTHHCSACNRCVLNMDHHCPWINTCIGFYNRKAFILMLIYTTIGTLLNILCFFGSIPGIYTKIKDGNALFFMQLGVIGIAFIFNCIIFFAITSFLKFHLQLIFNNYTTLETLELKRQGKDPGEVPSQYDIGNYYNWAQVFGRNCLTWPFPIYLPNQGPSGDGVIWPKKQ